MSAEQQTDGPAELTVEDHQAQIAATREALAGEQLVNRPLDRDFVIDTLAKLSAAVERLFGRHGAAPQPAQTPPEPNTWTPVAPGGSQEPAQ